MSGELDTSLTRQPGTKVILATWIQDEPAYRLPGFLYESLARLSGSRLNQVFWKQIVPDSQVDSDAS